MNKEGAMEPSGETNQEQDIREVLKGILPEAEIQEREGNLIVWLESKGDISRSMHRIVGLLLGDGRFSEVQPTSVHPQGVIEARFGIPEGESKKIIIYIRQRA